MVASKAVTVSHNTFKLTSNLPCKMLLEKISSITYTNNIICYDVMMINNIHQF